MSTSFGNDNKLNYFQISFMSGRAGELIIESFIYNSKVSYLIQILSNNALRNCDTRINSSVLLFKYENSICKSEFKELLILNQR